jgi:DNA-binding NarL/FixJ family response regulator
MKKKILLADDHHLFLQGVKSLLQEMAEVDVVATAANGQEAIQLIARHQPDLAMFDLNMPQMDGLKLLQHIKEYHSEVKALVFTSYYQPELIEEIRQLKADGYLNKNSAAAEVRLAIERVLAGHTYFPGQELAAPETKSYFFDDFLRRFQLTRREVEIIQWISKGLSSKEIAQKLFLSEFTISTHRKTWWN